MRSIIHAGTIAVVLGSTLATAAEDSGLATEAVPARWTQLRDKRSIDLLALKETKDHGVIATASGQRQKIHVVDQAMRDAGACLVQVALWDAPTSEWDERLQL